MARRSRTRHATHHSGQGMRWLAMFNVQTWARHHNWAPLEVAGATIGGDEQRWRQWIREASLADLEVVRLALAPVSKSAA